MDEQRKKMDMSGKGSVMSEGESPGMTTFQSSWRQGVWWG